MKPISSWLEYINLIHIDQNVKSVVEAVFTQINEIMLYKLSNIAEILTQALLFRLEYTLTNTFVGIFSKLSSFKTSNFIRATEREKLITPKYNCLLAWGNFIQR